MQNKAGGVKMKIRSISHSGLTVSNFENAVKWYYDIFGLRLISEQILDKEQAKRLYDLYKLQNTSIRLGFLRAPKGGVIEIFEFSPARKSEEVVWNKPGFTHITLDVRNVDKWYRKLKEKGVHFFSEPQDTSGAKWVFMRDPDGNLIELIDLRANYFAIRCLGGLVGKIMSSGKFKKYYI
jgi:catechol 2,3-dioxygenase-like lactoylglutathione lyase family enzyme